MVSRTRRLRVLAACLSVFLAGFLLVPFAQGHLRAAASSVSVLSGASRQADDGAPAAIASIAAGDESSAT